MTKRLKDLEQNQDAEQDSTDYHADNHDTGKQCTGGGGLLWVLGEKNRMEEGIWRGNNIVNQITYSDAILI